MAEVLNIFELCKLRKLSDPIAQDGEWFFVTATRNLELMGNPAKIAYGGCAMALTVTAAFATIEHDQAFTIYSMLGNYLGPTRADQPVRLHVRSIRQTRSFATRLILTQQQQPDGSWRNTTSTLCDFVVPQARDSPQTLLRFSVSPARAYPSPDRALTSEGFRKEFAKERKFTADDLKTYDQLFSPMQRYIDIRHIPDSMAVQKLWGIARDAKSSQDDRAKISERYSAEWARSALDLNELISRAKPEDNLSLRALHAALTVFWSDGMLSFLPLTHSGGVASQPYWFQDTSACSSLEFAFRWHTDSLNLDKKWHLREIQCLQGGHGRTYTEARAFDEAGTLVFTSSQQSVLRAAKKVAAGKL